MKANHVPARGQCCGLRACAHAGFEVDVIPNQGAGAATLRVEAARRIFPRCWFNEKTTQPGLEALGF